MVNFSGTERQPRFQFVESPAATVVTRLQADPTRRLAAYAASPRHPHWSHLKSVAELRLAAREWSDHDLVFPNARRTPTGLVVRSGDPLDGTNVCHQLQKLLAKAGLPPARVHDLRHGTATYLLGSGVPPRVVTQIMGWSQVSMLKRYQHVMDSMLTDPAERLEALGVQVSVSDGPLRSRPFVGRAANVRDRQHWTALNRVVAVHDPVVRGFSRRRGVRPRLRASVPPGSRFFRALSPSG